MREILFRGKRDKKYDKDQDWVYGVPYIDNEGDCIIADDCSKRVVVSETVGQYTGLTDKNSTKIFEGDICSNGGMIYQIIWLDDKYGWFCKVLKSNTCLIDTTMAFPLYQYNNSPENGYRQLEVIGNIHDNPELLKGDVKK